MSEQDDNYEDLTQCGLESELEQELLDVQRECTFMWTNKKGEAFGVIMSYLPSDGKIWLTCCLLYTSPSPRDRTRSRMPSSA